MRQKPLTPDRKFPSLQMQPDNLQNLSGRVEGLIDGVGGKDMLGVRIGVPEEPC